MLPLKYTSVFMKVSAIRELHKPNSLRAAPKLSVLLCSALLSGCLAPKHPVTPTKLESKWEEGKCFLEGNKLTYSSLGPDESIDLDWEIKNPQTLRCSAEFTVVIDGDRAIIAIGGRKILEGIYMLGSIHNTFDMANSLRINIQEPVSEGIQKVSLKNDRFVIWTSKSKWSIELSDLSAWTISDLK